MTPMRVQYERTEYLPVAPNSGAGKRHYRHLMLCDHEELLEAERIDLLRARRRQDLRASRIEGTVLGLVVLCLLAFFIWNGVSSAWSAYSSLKASRTPVPIVSVRVARGETLWTLAKHYGNPNTYILETVDGIARENSLSPGAPLAPGQVLKIAVRNPVLLAKMERRERPVGSRLAEL